MSLLLAFGEPTTASPSPSGLAQASPLQRPTENIMYTFAWPGAQIIPEAPDPNPQGLCKYNRGISALLGGEGGEFYFFYFLQMRNFQRQEDFSDVKPLGPVTGSMGSSPRPPRTFQILPGPSESQLSPLLV